ncbi:hypothetical protein, partial [Clostridium perfringens]|uniref:hypothetical protein n=1 Tax=Clostridium perfringens TaxID=1502 RepID=UPI00232B789E
MNINYINSLLSEGKTVKEVREILGYSEKKFQREIKNLGYKYDQKLRQYITINNTNKVVNTSDFNCNTLCNTERTTERNTLCTTESNTNIIDNADKENLNFIGENIELLKELLLYYKRNKESNTNGNGIVINLIDDKHKDNGKPKSVRVNYFVWEEWKEFTNENNF